MDFLSESFMRFHLIYYIEMAIYERCLQGYNQCMRQGRRYPSNAQDLKKNHYHMSNYILQEYCPVDPNSIHLQTLYFYSTEYKTYVQYKQYYYKVYTISKLFHHQITALVKEGRGIAVLCLVCNLQNALGRKAAWHRDFLRIHVQGRLAMVTNG